MMNNTAVIIKTGDQHRNSVGGDINPVLDPMVAPPTGSCEDTSYQEEEMVHGMQG